MGVESGSESSDDYGDEFFGSWDSEVNADLERTAGIFNSGWQDTNPETLDQPSGYIENPIAHVWVNEEYQGPVYTDKSQTDIADEQSVFWQQELDGVRFYPPTDEQ
jgi:hypothetical protein